MSEKFEQLNFDKELDAPPDVPKKEVKMEITRCPYCEDVGCCSYCDRGRRFAKENTDPDAYRKIFRSGKKRNK